MTSIRLCLVTIFCLVTGCADFDPQLSVTAAAATGPATVTTDATSYTYATDINVSWSGLSGNQTDWISIAPMGSPLTTITRWAYVNGAVSGSRLLEGPVPGGMYVARAFDNDSYNLMGESDPFNVASVSDTTATLVVDQTDYAIDQPIVVTWTGMPPNALDWVSIAPEGRADTVQAVWVYTGGTANGSLSFSNGLKFASQQGYPGGTNYVARLYLNDTYTRVAETAPVLVGSPVTTNASTYPANTPITVSWTHLPGGAEDWVALAPAGSKYDVVTRWLYTGGQVAGSQAFATGLVAAGTYVARAYAPNSYYIAGESAPFTVTPNAAGTITTDASTYATGQTVTVTWSGLPGNQHDWIALAADGSSDQVFVRWVYTNGAAAGSYAFDAPPSAGSFVARAFLNDTYNKLGESVVFTVTTGATATVVTDASSYTLAQNVTVTWSGLPGNQNDWIAIAPDGSSDQTVTRYVYTAGAAAGSFSFQGPPGAGSYVARAFINDTYAKLAESAAFAVN